MTTALEVAVWRASTELRLSAFGRQLRAGNPRGVRHDAEGSLARWEIDQGPPLHRTLFALEFCDITDTPFDRQGEREHVLWTARAVGAVGSFAARCWGEVPLDLLAAAIDQDDLGVVHSRYIPYTRRGPADGRAERIAGLRDGRVGEALMAVVSEVLETESYRHVVASVRALRQHGGRRGLEKVDRRVRRELDDIEEQTANVVAAGGPLRERVASAYSNAPAGVAEAGRAIQAHNELVQAVLWTLLGVADQLTEPDPWTSIPPASRIHRTGRHHDLTVTLPGLAFSAFASPPAPFMVASGTPADGIYLSRRQFVQMMHGSLTDMTGRRLGALEAAAP